MNIQAQHPIEMGGGSGLLSNILNPDHLLENIVDVVCLMDAKGIFQYVSPAAQTFWGYHPDEMTGRSVSEFLLPQDIAASLAILGQAADGAFTSHFQNHYICKNGAIAYVSWSARWVEAHGLYYCVGRDGSGQRALEQRLLKAQEIAGVANFEFDVRQRHFTYISDNIYTIAGLTKPADGVFSIHLLWDLLHPDDVHWVKTEIRAPALPGAKRQNLYRLIRPDGALLYLQHNRELVFDAAGRHIKTVGTLQDVTQQKLSELALQQSKKKFRTLVQNGSDLLGILSTEGKYLYVGESVNHLLGYSPAELIGTSVADLIHPEDAVQIPALLQQVLTQKRMAIPPLRFLHKNGQWRWVESAVTNQVNDPDIGGLVYNSHDITERKETNDRLRELSLIAQESQLAILITDLQHRITWVNKALCQLSGYSPEEMVGKIPQEIWDGGAIPEEVNKAIQNQLEKTGGVQMELLCYSKTGNPYWMDLNVHALYDEGNRPLKYMAIGKDITDKKKVREALALSEQKFKAMVQESSDLMVIVDGEGCFTYISDSVQKALGYMPEELLGQQMLRFIHPDDVAETIAGMQRVKTNQALNGVVHRFCKKDGTYTWLESKGTNHFDNPLIGGMIVNARDITDRVELQKRLDAELHNKQKEITSAVIKAQEGERSKLGLELHDNVNQVLTTVKLYNEMYLSGLREDRALLERSTQYLQECINEIRSISKRLSAPTLGKISLHDSIADLVESVNLTARLQICLVQEDLDHLPISEDLHLGVYRIIQEALNNIIKYSAATEATITLVGQEDGLWLTIRDNGKGFDPAQRWTGIGLTNMKTRAEHMNGSFLLQTAPGKGCTIRVHFLLPKA